MSFRNILIVDANLDSAYQLSRTLGALGYHAEVAGNGLAAIRLAGRVRFDVGIISEVLPDGEGPALFQRIHVLQSGMRGVLLAAVGNLASVYTAVSAGMQRVLTRPINFGQLLPVVEAAGPHEPSGPQVESVMHKYDEQSIADLTSEEIRFRLSRDELVEIIRSVEFPFAGKDRLQFFDRDTLERVAHLVRRWCQSRVSVISS